MMATRRPRASRTDLASVAKPETEAQFQNAIVELARYNGWEVYHTHDSRRSDPGYPDLSLCKPPRFIVAEVKTAKGRVRVEQKRWLVKLALCPGIETYLWRPQDWPAIVAALVDDTHTERPGLPLTIPGRPAGITTQSATATCEHTETVPTRS